jgi:Neuraminidase (sialidase)
MLRPCSFLAAALLAAGLRFAPAARPALGGGAAAPMIEKTDLFEAGKGGYALYRIPGIVVTTRGTLLAYCEARKEASGDWCDIDLWMRRSTDGGKTWEAARKVVEPPAKVADNPAAVKHKLGIAQVTVNNPVAISDRKTGAVHFLYCLEYGRCYYLRSEDDGRTFTRPVDITATFEKFRRDYPWQVLATGPGHGIQLRGGRLLVPVWLSTGEGGHAHRPSCVAVIYSDDHGKTWERGAIVAADPEPKNPSETAAVELQDGRVLLNLRHEGYKGKLFRAVTISPDGATRWGPLKLDAGLPEPVCMGSIVRLSARPKQDRDRILFANPNPASGRARKNLTVRLSYDEGKTWPVAKALEAGVSGYSDLAVGPDGMIYCLYERGSADGSHFRPTRLCVARFNLEWLTDGKDRLRGREE